MMSFHKDIGGAHTRLRPSRDDGGGCLIVVLIIISIGVLALSSCAQRRPATQPACPDCPKLVVNDCPECPEPIVCPEPVACPPVVVCPDCPECPDCPPTPPPVVIIEPMPCPDPMASTGPYEADYVLYPDTPLLVPGKPFDAVGANKWSEKGTKLGVWNVAIVTISRADNSTIRFVPEFPHISHSYANPTVNNYLWGADIIQIGPWWSSSSDPNYYNRDRRFIDIDVRPMKILWLLLKFPGPYKFVGTNGVPTWEHPMLPLPQHARLTERR